MMLIRLDFFSSNRAEVTTQATRQSSTAPTLVGIVAWANVPPLAKSGLCCLSQRPLPNSELVQRIVLSRAFLRVLGG